MEKKYQFEVKIIEDCSFSAKNEKEAIKRLKDIWLEEHNIKLVDKEISLISVVSEKKNKDGTLDITID